jgi:hypothetical protein
MTKILIKRGTHTQWTSSLIPLAVGELGLDTTNDVLKVGNGTDLWIDLSSFVLSTDLSNSLGDYVPIGDVGNPDGVASLDSTGNVPISQLGNIISGAPAVLDTLNELAAALNNDQNFTNTVNTALSGKVSKSGGDTIIPSSASTVGLIIKAATGQSADIQQWKTSGNFRSVWINQDGEFNVGYSFINFGGSGSVNAGLLTIAPTGNIVPLAIRGISGQTANLQEWKNSAGTLLSAITSSGDLNFNSNLWNIKANGTNVIQWQPTTGSTLISYGSSNTPITIQGSSGQTGDLTKWRDSNANTLIRIDSSGAIYLINPTANNNSNDTPSPEINFQGNIWNSSYGNQNIKGAIKVAAYAGNTNPTISKMSFLLATDNGTPAEVASFTNTGAFSNIGGLDSYGTGVVFRLRNTTDATTAVISPSPKLELMGRAWNSSQGSAPTRAYLQVNANNNNSDPFINRLGFFVATGNNAGGWIYGADATEYMSILGNGTVGINSTTPLATLDIRPINSSTKGLLIRSAASQATNLIDIQDSSGTTVARVAENGQAMFPYYWDALTQGESQGARIALQAPSASNPVAIFKARSSQTANLQEWQNSAGTALSYINASGGLTATEVVGSTTYSGGKITGGTLGYLNASTFNASVSPIVVRGAASQSANLQEWQKSDGTKLASISSDGTSMLGAIYVTYGPHKIYGSLENWGNPSGVASTSILAYGYSGSASLTIGVKNTDNVNNRNWQLFTGGGGYAGQSGAYIGEGGLIFQENNPNDSSSVIRGGFRRGGQFTLGGESTYSASLSVTPLSTSTAGLVVRGITSQTSNLQEWQNSSGTALTSISTTGKLTITNTSASASLIEVLGSGSGTFVVSQTGGIITNGGLSSIGGGSYFGGYGGAGNVVVTVTGASGQTGDLQKWTNFAGTVLAKVDSSGSIFTTTASAGVNTTQVATTAFVKTAVDNDNLNIYITDSGPSRTLSANDTYKVIEMTSSSSTTITIPNDASDSTFPIGSWIEIRQMGSGQITVLATSPATVVATDNQFKTRVQYSSIVLEKRASNAWYLAGDTAA